MRLDREADYLEITCEGPALCEVFGTVGAEPTRRSTKFATAKAAATALAEVVAEKKREGFRETKASDVKQRVAEYLGEESVEQRAFLNAWMATLGPALRKSVRYPKGGLLDVEREQDRCRLELAASLFAQADQAYWEHHDPATLPYVQFGWYGHAWACRPMLNAIDAGLTKPWKTG